MESDPVSGRLRLTGHLVCASEAEIELIRRHLPVHIGLTRAEPGCLSFEVTQTDDPMVWRVDELFVDQVAFDAHQTRTRASAWAHHTASIRRDYEVSIVGGEFDRG